MSSCHTELANDLGISFPAWHKRHPCLSFLHFWHIECRADQQVDLLNSLQNYMMTPRSPCGHAKRASELQQAPHLVTSTMNPIVMSYLASSRLPSVASSFSIFTQVCPDTHNHFPYDLSCYSLVMNLP